MNALKDADLLKAKNELLKAHTANPTKRKRINPDVVPVLRSPKNARRDASPGRSAFTNIELSEELEREEAGEGSERFLSCILTLADPVFAGQNLMRTLCHLNTYLKPGVDLEEEAHSLTYYLTQAAASISPIVNDAVKEHMASDDGNATLKATLTAVGRVIAVIFTALVRIERTERSASMQAQVVHAFVTMFGSLIDELDTVSKSELVSSMSSDAAIAGRKVKPKAHNRINIQDHPTLNTLAAFLGFILKQLDSKHDSHQALFEGLTFKIISKLGVHLHTIAFGFPRGSLEGDLRAFAAPVEGPATPAVHCAKLEAPYYLHLLKIVLAMAHLFIGPAQQDSKVNKVKCVPKPGSVTKLNISMLAKERLQRALVNAVFGTQGLEEDSAIPVQCLRMPVLSDARVTVPRVKETEVAEWFKDEVWRLLGWELLGREVGV